MKHNGYQIVCEAINDTGDEIVHKSIYINLPSSRQQTNFTCGPIALRSIAKYYGKDLDNEKAFKDLCDAGKVKGTHPEDMANAARALGLKAIIKDNMTIEELTHYISKKIPVVCAIQAYGKEEEYDQLKDGHYVVAIGFDNDNIYFEDPSVKGKRPFLPKDEFLKRWIDKEAFVPNPIRKRLGILIYGKHPENYEIISKTVKLQ